MITAPAARLTAAAPVIEARDLGRSFGAQPALDGLDLTVSAGESVLLLGPNGAGKTTLLRTLATLLRPGRGGLRLFGIDTATGDRSAVRRRIGLLAHQTYLYDHLTALENLVFYGRLYGRDMDGNAVRAALREVGLEERSDEKVRALSRGMQQRLALARVFAHMPDLLLLDEPFTGLDRLGAERLHGMLRARLLSGATCLLASHDVAAALPLATRVIVLAAGRLAADRPASGIDARGVDAIYRAATADLGERESPA